MNREWRSDPDAEKILRDIATLPFIVGTINLKEIDWSESANNCARLSDPLNKEKIEDYITCMNNGDVFPRIVVEIKKKSYVILGGNQRCAALKSIDPGADVECYIVDPLTSGEREIVIRSLNSRHGWGSTKEERIEHAVYLVRKFGMHVDTVARAMVVGASSINLRIRAEDERANLARQGVDSSGIARCALAAIASIPDESTKVRIAKIAVEKHATGDAISEVASAVAKAKSKASTASIIADFSKNLEAIEAIKGSASRSRLKKPRREKFLSLLTNLSQFLENGNDGKSFSTLDELSCSLVHDLDSVRMMAAKINGRLQCICEAGK